MQGTIVYQAPFGSNFFFGLKSYFQELIKELDDSTKVLIIRMGNVPRIDQSGVSAIEEAIRKLQNDGVVLTITSLQPQPLDMLNEIDVIPGLLPEMHLFKTFGDCEIWLKHNLKNKNGGLDRLSKNSMK
ncbi:MAG: SulP family sulfate permease [Flavobacteriales bacterium]|jgi:SulP family sulfate permease